MSKDSLARIFARPSPYLLALGYLLVLWSVPVLLRWLLQYAGNDDPAEIVIQAITPVVRKKLAWPISDWLRLRGGRWLLLIPYAVLLSLGLRAVYLATRKWILGGLACCLALLLFLALLPNALLVLDSTQQSTSYGTSLKGRVEHARRIPFKGEHHRFYSWIAFVSGRSFVHEKVKATLLKSVNEIAEKWNRIYVVGECGDYNGGKMLLNKRHQNGLTVDLLLPINEDSRPFFKQSFYNRFNYNLKFTETIQPEYKVLRDWVLEIYRQAKQNGLILKQVRLSQQHWQPLLVHCTQQEKKMLQGLLVKKPKRFSGAYFTVEFSASPSPKKG